MPAECYDSSAFFYVQFSCLTPEVDQYKKYNIMCTTVAIICLIAYLFTISLRLLFQGGKIQ